MPDQYAKYTSTIIPAGTALPIAEGGTGGITAAAARTALGIAIGVDVQAFDTELAALAGLASAADRLPYFTGAGTAALATFTAFGRSVVDDADAPAARTTLGLVIGTDVQAFDATLLSLAALGTVADRIAYTTALDVWAETPLTAFGRSIVDDASAAAGRTTLGVVIGTDVQAWDTDLDALAALDATAGYLVKTGAAAYARRTLTGTANQVAVTNGDGTVGNPVLSTPQDIHSGASPTFAGLTLNGTLTRAADSIIDLTGAATRTLDLINSTVSQVANFRADGTLAFRNGTALQIILSGTPTGADKTATFQDVTGTVYVTSGTDVAVADGGTGSSTAAGARTNLGLVIGTDVQAFDATLLSLAALGTVADRVAYTTALDTWAETPLTAFGRSLIDDASAAAGRTTLGVVIGTDVQAWDADLDAVAALATTGLAARTGAATWANRTLTAPAAGFTITNPAGVAGDPTFVLANDLSALEGLGTTGLAVRSAADTWLTRSIVGTADQVTVANGDGVGGNPTLSIPTAWTTFTPTVTLVGGAGNVVPVYVTNTGRYRNIGGVVHVDIYLTGDGGLEGAGTGRFNVALPVAANASHPTNLWGAGYGLNGTTSFALYGQIAPSATTVELSYFSLINTVVDFTGADQNNTIRTVRLKFFYEA